MMSEITSSPVRAGGCRARRPPLRPIGRTSSSWKRIALPPLANSMTSRAPSVMATPTSRSPSSQLDRDDAARRAAARNAASGVFLTVPLRGRHEHELVFLVLPDRQHGVDALAFLQRQQVHDRLAARAAAGLRQLVDLQPVDLAAAGEAQQRVVRVGDEQLVDEVLVLDRGRRLAAPAAALRLVLARPAAPWRSRRATASRPRPPARSGPRSSDRTRSCSDLGAALRRRTGRGSRAVRRGSPACRRSGRARMSSESAMSVE